MTEYELKNIVKAEIEDHLAEAVCFYMLEYGDEIDCHEIAYLFIKETINLCSSTIDYYEDYIKEQNKE